MSSKTGSIRRRKILAPGINLTPLLDAILNLVFFFLVSTQLRNTSESVKVNLPASETATSASAKQVPTLTLDAEGKVYYEGRVIRDQELEPVVRKIASDGAKEIDVRSDKESHVGRALELMDVCKKSGINVVNFNAERKKSGNPR